MNVPFIVSSKVPPFFPKKNLPCNPDGVVALGGALDDNILLEAYAKGYFPWYESRPVIWYSPLYRAVLFPEEFTQNKRFQRFVRNADLKVAADTQFEQIIDKCGSIYRPGQNGTWINKEMLQAYKHLHTSGYAHSFEVFSGSKLVGGLYGVSLGASFFGESMFSTVPNASKLALYVLVEFALNYGFSFIDCQVETNHLKSLGANKIPKKRFEDLLTYALNQETIKGQWTDRVKKLAVGKK